MFSKPAQILLLLLLSCCIGCGSSQKGPASTPYNKHGVSFSIPAGWSITEDETYDAAAYVCCEKKGMDESGIATLMIFEDSLDLEEILSAYASSLQDNTVAKHSGFTLEDLTEASFGKHTGIGRAYTMSILGLSHKGRLCAFYADNKSVVVGLQEAAEDEAENRSGFDAIARSFTVDNTPAKP